MNRLDKTDFKFSINLNDLKIVMCFLYHMETLSFLSQSLLSYVVCFTKDDLTSLIINSFLNNVVIDSWLWRERRQFTIYFLQFFRVKLCCIFFTIQIIVMNGVGRVGTLGL